ncbi:MAG TPA: 2,3-diaminopropionate biosynthesis protein SbnB [Thermoanaerobaculia bacterium]|nr:2,3-diaminopropionate biosynthesis protein SbnB [Thermoanaerobaculia bacterium]
MAGDGLLILRGEEVAELLAQREAEIVETVRRAYRVHAAGQSSLPHSTFVRFPNDEVNRIIALPAFLGDGFGLAGVKWISSFPGNVQRGHNRATAVLVLNSTRTGEPEAIVEASIISAKRTAASAAAAAVALLAGSGSPSSVGLIGTGVINFEVARFLRAVLPGLGRFRLFDLDAERAGRCAAALRGELGADEVEIAPDAAAVLAGSPLVSIGTTAIRPYIEDLSPCPPGAVVLHISLRDLAPGAILAADNVVDDIDHVCRAETSIHLAEKLAGSRGFIRGTLADILDDRMPARGDPGQVTVFSPFGLGVLDLALGKLVLEAARAAGKGIYIEGFQPRPGGAARSGVGASPPPPLNRAPDREESAGDRSPRQKAGVRHLLSVRDLGTDDLLRLIEDSLAIARGEWSARRPLAGKVVGLYFRKTSTRTRTAFGVGAMKLGASTIAYGPNDLQINTGETVSDTARVLTNFLDILVVRTNEALQEMKELSAQNHMSVVNAMSDNEHPSQAIADLVALEEALGRLAGVHLLFLGEGNNTAASLALAAARIAGMRVTLVTPEGYGLPAQDLEDARRLAAQHGAAVEQHHDMSRLPAGVDAVYTTRWLTMGVSKADADWLSRFRPYAVTPEVMRRVSKPSGTILLHDLPAMRGYEVTDDVLDGPQSIAFRQAFHKLTSAMAILAWCGEPAEDR